MTGTFGGGTFGGGTLGGGSGSSSGEPSWRPSTADVAAIIPARVQEPGVGKVDDFSADSYPTKVAVEGKINTAMRRIASAIGGYTICEEAAEHEEDAKGATALYAAMLCEQGYWPSETSNQNSSFKNLESLWKDAIKDLAENVGRLCGTGVEAEEGGGGTLPKAGPSDGVELLGRTHPRW